MLETFYDRLRDCCAHDGGCHGPHRADRIKNQTEHTVALAREIGILIKAPLLADDFLQDSEEIWIGSEHFVEFSEIDKRYGKTTKPPAFGLVPELRRLPSVNLRNDPAIPPFRETIEFVPATPLEYLGRWIASNTLFNDDVHLASVIQWTDGAVSMGITQPHYHGQPAESRDIESHFLAAGWERLKDPDGHMIFYNFAFDVIAADVARRNCYLTEGNLQPFDVILREPDEDLRRFLRIY